MEFPPKGRYRHFKGSEYELLDFARSASPAAESVKEMSHESLPAAFQSRPPSSVRSGPMQ